MTVDNRLNICDGSFILSLVCMGRGQAGRQPMMMMMHIIGKKLILGHYPGFLAQSISGVAGQISPPNLKYF